MRRDRSGADSNSTQREKLKPWKTGAWMRRREGMGGGAPSEEGCEAALDALLDGGEGERGIIKKNTAAR